MLTPEQIKGFAGAVLSKRYDDPVPTPAIHLEWWQMCCSKERLVSIAAPRYHAKSTAITHAYLLAELLFRESKFALIVSDTEQQAKDFLGDVIIDLSSNEDLINLFDIVGFEKDTESNIVVNFKDGKQFKVVAKGAGQKVRGIKWNQQRPDLIIIDDLENDENVATKEQRTKLKRWVNGALIPCMSRKGRLRAVGTIIHTDSWLASTMPNESSPDTVKEPLKVYSRHNNKGWYSAKYRGHPGIGDYSQLLWPGYRTAAFFKTEYTRLEAEGQSDVYSAEQLNEPLDETHAYFRKSDFTDIPADTRRKMQLGEIALNYYSSADLAISTAARADFTVLGTIGVDEAGQIYLLDVVRDRFHPDDTVDEIFRLEKRFHPGMFLVEKGILDKAIGPMLQKEMMTRKSFPMLTPISVSGDKRLKATGIRKAMRAGAVYVDKQAEWYPAFEDELLRFDRGTHDDQVDMFALFGLKLDELIDAPTQEEIEEEEYQEEFGEFIQQGKNPVTGY